MKFEYNENEYGLDITLTPENPKEVSQLARFTKNAKAEKPSLYMAFSDNPYMNVHMKKVAKQNQNNSLSNTGTK